MARPLALVPALALILGGVACSSDVPEPAVSQSPTPAAVESPTSTEPAPEPESPEPSPSETAAAFQGPDVNLTDEQQEAVDTVEEFFHYYDKAFEDPTQPFQRLSEIAEGEYLRMLSELIVAEADNGVAQRGQPKYEVLRTTTQTVEAESWVDVFVCADLEGVRTVDTETGDTVNHPEEPFQLFQLRLRNSGEWKIPEGGNRWSSDCALPEP